MSLNYPSYEKYTIIILQSQCVIRLAVASGSSPLDDAYSSPAGIAGIFKKNGMGFASRILPFTVMAACELFWPCLILGDKGNQPNSLISRDQDDSRVPSSAETDKLINKEMERIFPNAAIIRKDEKIKEVYILSVSSADIETLMWVERKEEEMKKFAALRAKDFIDLANKFEHKEAAFAAVSEAGLTRLADRSRNEVVSYIKGITDNIVMPEKISLERIDIPFMIDSLEQNVLFWKNRLPELRASGKEIRGSFILLFRRFAWDCYVEVMQNELGQEMLPADIVFSSADIYRLYGVCREYILLSKEIEQGSGEKAEEKSSGDMRYFYPREDYFCAEVKVVSRVPGLPADEAFEMIKWIVRRAVENHGSSPLSGASSSPAWEGGVYFFRRYLLRSTMMSDSFISAGLSSPSSRNSILWMFSIASAVSNRGRNTMIPGWDPNGYKIRLPKSKSLVIITAFSWMAVFITVPLVAEALPNSWMVVTAKPESLSNFTVLPNTHSSIRKRILMSGFHFFKEVNFFILHQLVGVSDAGVDVGGRNLRKVILSGNLFRLYPGGQEVKYLPNHYSMAFYAGFPVAYIGVYGYAIEEISHNRTNIIDTAKSQDYLRIIVHLLRNLFEARFPFSTGFIFIADPFSRIFSDYPAGFSYNAECFSGGRFSERRGRNGQPLETFNSIFQYFQLFQYLAIHPSSPFINSKKIYTIVISKNQLFNLFDNLSVRVSVKPRIGKAASPLADNEPIGKVGIKSDSAKDLKTSMFHLPEWPSFLKPATEERYHICLHKVISNLLEGGYIKYENIKGVDSDSFYKRNHLRNIYARFSSRQKTQKGKFSLPEGSTLAAFIPYYFGFIRPRDFEAWCQRKDDDIFFINASDKIINEIKGYYSEFHKRLLGGMDENGVLIKGKKITSIFLSEKCLGRLSLLVARRNKEAYEFLYYYAYVLAKTRVWRDRALQYSSASDEVFTLVMDGLDRAIKKGDFIRKEGASMNTVIMKQIRWLVRSAKYDYITKKFGGRGLSKENFRPDRGLRIVTLKEQGEYGDPLDNLPAKEAGLEDDDEESAYQRKAIEAIKNYLVRKSLKPDRDKSIIYARLGIDEQTDEFSKPPVPLKEISNKFMVTESRICQIISRLREYVQSERVKESGNLPEPSKKQNIKNDSGQLFGSKGKFGSPLAGRGVGCCVRTGVRTEEIAGWNNFMEALVFKVGEVYSAVNEIYVRIFRTKRAVLFSNFRLIYCRGPP